MIKILSFAAVMAVTTIASSQVLYSNAVAHGLEQEGLRTSAKAGGGSWSEVQQGNMVCGFRGSVNPGAYDRLADDFTVPPVGWLVSGASFFMYQTDAVGATINGGMFEIRQKVNGTIGPKVGSGHFRSAVATDIFRIFRNQPAENRRIQRVDVIFDAVLPGGDYYLVWACTGTLNRTGPWGPYLTKAGWQTVTGANALQSNTGGATWMTIQDGLKNQDFPFIIYGTTGLDVHGGNEIVPPPAL